jgi:hypothetical protein
VIIIFTDTGVRDKNALEATVVETGRRVRSSQGVEDTGSKHV